MMKTPYRKIDLQTTYLLVVKMRVRDKVAIVWPNVH